MHYGVGVVPARLYKPRDKAKVESGVQLAERWIIATLRHRKFYSSLPAEPVLCALLENGSLVLEVQKATAQTSPAQ